MYCEPITKDEIVTVCAFQNNKSPGPDNIGPKLLKSVLIHIVDPLQFTFNLSFVNGCVSKSLKIAKVIPLFKKVIKQCYYRPISLLSVFDKLLEKLMHKRLYAFFTKHSILSQYQFVFRKKTYYIVSINNFELLDSLHSHIDKQDIVLVMFLICRKRLILLIMKFYYINLYNYDVRGTVYSWFSDYLSNNY